MISDPDYNIKAEILREKGTNRSQFFRGQVAKYNWVGYGSSYLPSDINAAYLWGQLQYAEQINEQRLAVWDRYYKELQPLAQQGKVELPIVPEGCIHNAHIFYLKCKDLEQRTAFIDFMKQHEILCVFHYVPLHSAPAGLNYGVFVGEDKYTTSESDRLVRLPLYYNMTKADLDKVIQSILEFFNK